MSHSWLDWKISSENCFHCGSCCYSCFQVLSAPPGWTSETDVCQICMFPKHNRKQHHKPQLMTRWHSVDAEFGPWLDSFWAESMHPNFCTKVLGESSHVSQVLLPHLSSSASMVSCPLTNDQWLEPLTLSWTSWSLYHTPPDKSHVLSIQAESIFQEWRLPGCQMVNLGHVLCAKKVWNPLLCTWGLESKHY